MAFESDRKPCPYCAEPIAAAAAKCRFCGEWLTETDESALVAELEDALKAQSYGGPGASDGRTGRLFKKELWSLRPGERIVSRSQPYIRRELILMFVIVLPFVLLTLVLSRGLSVLLFAVPGLFWLYFRLMRFEWILTDRRLIAVGGWLTRGAQGVSLDKVNEIHYRRGFLQRIFLATGTVVVESAATAGSTQLARAADDDPFRHAIETQLELRRRAIGMRSSPMSAAHGG